MGIRLVSSYRIDRPKKIRDARYTGRPAIVRFDLRQVITERREDHIVDSVWLRRNARCTTRAGPSVANDVGVLRPPLDAALLSCVNAIPESQRAFDDIPGVSGAVR